MPAAVPLIRPISDLRTDLNDVCAQAQETQQPIVVIDCVAYEEQRQHERYVQKLREAEIEEKYRKETISQASLDETMERIFEVWGV